MGRESAPASRHFSKARALTRRLPQTKDIPTIAAKLAALPKKTSKPRTVVITQGPSSTVVASLDASAFSSSKAKVTSVEGAGILTVPVKPLPDDQIVDTNGAGDAFAGGYMGALVLGKSTEEAVEVGHKLGQMCVGQVGPQLKWPKDDVLA